MNKILKFLCFFFLAWISQSFAVNEHAFNAYSTIATSIPNNTSVILPLTKIFDTNNEFWTTFFTPTQAWYYFCNGQFYGVAPNVGVGLTPYFAVSLLYNTGVSVAFWKSANIRTLTAGDVQIASTSTIIYLNGLTDNIQLQAWFFNGWWSATSGIGRNTSYLTCHIIQWYIAPTVLGGSSVDFNASSSVTMGTGAILYLKQWGLYLTDNFYDTIFGILFLYFFCFLFLFYLAKRILWLR